MAGKNKDKTHVNIESLPKNLQDKYLEYAELFRKVSKLGAELQSAADADWAKRNPNGVDGKRELRMKFEASSGWLNFELKAWKATRGKERVEFSPELLKQGEKVNFGTASSTPAPKDATSIDDYAKEIDQRERARRGG